MTDNKHIEDNEIEKARTVEITGFLERNGIEAKVIAMGNETHIIGAELEAVKFEGYMNKELRYSE